MSKHTEGPWIIDKSRAVMTSDYHIIADIFSWMGPQEADANARLIAAAPEMFDALKAIDSMETWEQIVSAKSKLRAAIKKAE